MSPARPCWSAARGNADLTDPVLTALPRGLAQDGGKLSETVVVAANPLRWTSKYGGLVTTVYGIGTADRLNERGLSAHMLYLDPIDFGPRDRAKPALQAGLGRNTCSTTRRPLPKP